MENTYLSIKEIQEIVSKDLQEVNNIIINNIGNEVPLIKDLSRHILASGGKRIRPMVTLLSSTLCNYSGKNHLFLAACVEFIHTATLLHDDVIDESKIRRGVATANDIFGNKTSVLVGDFLFSRAFELMVQNGSKQILEILSKALSIFTIFSLRLISEIVPNAVMSPIVVMLPLLLSITTFAVIPSTIDQLLDPVPRDTI